MSTLWLRPNPALGMRGDEEGFDRADRDSYHIVKDGRGEPVNSDTLREEEVNLNSAELQGRVKKLVPITSLRDLG